jgi:RimJ/RimL family protein N-acetyltransferase
MIQIPFSFRDQGDTPSGAIRSYRDEDAQSLARHANDRAIWRNMRDRFPHPYAIEDAWRFIAHARSRQPESFLAIDIGGEVVGGIGYTLHEDIERVGAELGYWLATAFWGRGIMSGAVAAFTTFVFDRHAELRRLYAVPLAWNAASAVVLEKAGYRLEGRLRQSAIKDGVVVDQLMYSILRDEMKDASR